MTEHTDRNASPILGKRRLEFLDALRGLAAVYVVVYHMLLIPQPHLVAPRWAEKFAMAGGTGVTLFFIVSAFSLYYTMPLRLKENSPALNFYLHRFFRIAPLFYFLIAATLIRDYFTFGVTHSLAAISASATFIFNLIPTKQEGFVWAGWTIGVEMLFYATVPFLYARIKTTGNAIALFFGCLLLWALMQLMLDYSGMPDAWKQSILQWSVFKHFPIFAVGIAVYHLFMAIDASPLSATGKRSLGNALLWASLFLFYALLQDWLPAVFGDNYYWQGLIFGALFLGLAFSPLPLLVNGVSRYLGKVSYSVYLNHPSIVFFSIPVYRWIYSHSASVTLGFLGSLSFTLAIVLPLSSLTYRYIEAPGIEWGKKAARWLQARHALTTELDLVRARNSSEKAA